MNSILLYVVIGIIWSCWLEYFCTSELDSPYDKPFTNSERGFHTAVWPLSLSSFLYYMLKDFFK